VGILNLVVPPVGGDDGGLADQVAPSRRWAMRKLAGGCES
jgi:hypothetical protein